VTDVVKVALIAAIPSTIAALISWRNSIKANKLAISVDGRLTELLEGKDAKNIATAISSKAEGVLEEKARHENSQS
jgi:hypothetical protein